ncbi:MAG: hypothetical protein GF401_04895, partial [Chitinivibrionales bacterium]|nr:hypothetical protein [Chitinivibrionales bacterium]
PRIINEVEQVVKSIDHPHILVMLKTRIIEVSNDKLNKYGIDWQALSHIGGEITYLGDRLLDGIQPDRFLKSDIRFSTILDLLVADGDGKMLMDSRLTTTNNRTASLHIGEIIPYAIQSYNLSSAGGANLQIQKEEVGVKLTMTPHVNENSQVTLTVEPEVSSVIGFKGPSSDIPHIRTRKTNTTIRIEDGQTVFIAGLFREDHTTEIRRLPLLGHIPGLGLLFQHRKENVIKTNLIIEITPRIIFDAKDSAISSDEARKFIEKDAGEILKKLGIKKRR